MSALRHSVSLPSVETMPVTGGNHGAAAAAGKRRLPGGGLPAPSRHGRRREGRFALDRRRLRLTGGHPAACNLMHTACDVHHVLHIMHARQNDVGEGLIVANQKKQMNLRLQELCCSVPCFDL